MIWRQTLELCAAHLQSDSHRQNEIQTWALPLWHTYTHIINLLYSCHVLASWSVHVDCCPDPRGTVPSAFSNRVLCLWPLSPTRHLDRKDAQRSTWVIELFIAPAPALTHALTQIAVRTVTHSYPIKPPLVRVSKNLKDFNGRLSFHLICLEEDREVAQ